jgi:hypothetical protein
MRFFERLMDWESRAEFIGVICGLGVLGYICTTWILALWGRGNYVVATTASLAGFLLSLLALARVPIALVLIFGAAAVAIAAFLSGHLNIFLP